MKASAIVEGVLICTSLAFLFRPQLSGLIDRLHNWRLERAWRKRHTRAGRAQ